ncbi:pilus assembly protein [Chromobacterium haemolyticum]|uniref:Pilus assembly protein n=1 Tax=Chromobacterium fluminis TaxID=3044269 RepID=A0ABX0L936_9NEIS|nr:pilus assembly protein [Chromobacterium haemolyticum]NHR06087.1 pilus assembly protein [Chromobacterium haemolyticum]
MRGLRPRGAVLWLILPLLSLLTVLAMGTARSVAVEQRATRNLAEQRELRLAALQALRAAERRVLDLNLRFEDGLAGESGVPWQGDGRGLGWFMPDCLSTIAGVGYGLCATEPDLWRRSVQINGARWPLLHPCGPSRPLEPTPDRPPTSCLPARIRAGQRWSPPRYVLELLNPAFRFVGVDGRLFRISVRVWGESERSALTVQSWFWAGAGAQAGRGGRLNWRQLEEE